MVVIVFMLLGGVNFALYYRLLQGQFRAVLRDTELRWYLGLLLGAWGPIDAGDPIDLTADGHVDAIDLAVLLANWSPASG